MGSSASALIIYETYVYTDSFINQKIATNDWSTIAGAFKTSQEAKIKIKLPLNIPY